MSVRSAVGEINGMRLPAGLGNPREMALFFDFDGTLVELEEHPDRVSLAETTRQTLSRLAAATGGAVAIITGRDIESVDHFLSPLCLPVSGVHGLMRRAADGTIHAPAVRHALSVDAEAVLAPLLARAPRLLLERKSAALALHYRQAPEYEEECIAAMERIADVAPGMRVMRNKMVVEVRPEGADKGAAVAAFLREPPFAGRKPMFAGDDVTDEDAFVVVNALGGVSIKIGDGQTAARWRASGTAAFLAWLDACAAVASSGARPKTDDGSEREAS